MSQTTLVLDDLISRANALDDCIKRLTETVDSLAISETSEAHKKQASDYRSQLSDAAASIRALIDGLQRDIPPFMTGGSNDVEAEQPVEAPEQLEEDANEADEEEMSEGARAIVEGLKRLAGNDPRMGYGMIPREYR